MLGVSRQAVSGWIKLYKEGGLSAFKAQKKGYLKGTHRHLTSQ